MKPLVSIIIVNFNGLKWLERCFNSLLKQDYENIEIILVDNNSSDESVSFTREYFPQVHVVNNKQNLGFAKANNIGAQTAQGEYLLLLNNDTHVEKDFLAQLIQSFDEIDQLGCVGPMLKNFDGSIQDTGIKIDRFGFPRGNGLSDFPEKHIFDLFYCSGAAMCVPTTLYQQLNGLDEDFFMFSEEVDFIWRLRLRGYKVAVNTNSVVHHFGGGTLEGGPQKTERYITNTKRILWRERHSLAMLLKNYQWWNLLLYLPLYGMINIAEMLLFLVTLKPHVSFIYLQSWWWNLTQLPNTLRKRRALVRTVSDRAIKRHMYGGAGKWSSLWGRGIPIITSS